MAAASANPFRMPSDEEVFLLRDDERRRRAAERVEGPTQKGGTSTSAAATRSGYGSHTGGLYSTSSSKHDGLTTPPAGPSGGYGAGGWSAPRIPTSGAAAAAASGNGTTYGSVTAGSMAAGGAAGGATASGTAGGAGARDNMSRYIARKRRMGLERMALATKRQEIRKLDEEALRAERRVTQQEEQLRETEAKFRAFLEQSDLEQVEAFKRAEAETKAKQEKAAVIKQLSAQIAQVETDRKKNDESLRACLEYKKFLDMLTPTAWFVKTLTNLRIEDATNAINAWAEQELNEAVAGTPAEEDEVAAQRAAIHQQAEAKKAEARAMITSQILAMPIEQVLAALDSTESDRVPMYFTKPDEILVKFVEIEEGNLFLINTCQGFEEQIEDIAQKFQLEQQEMAQIVAARKQQTLAVMRSIEDERVKMEQLKERIAAADDKGTDAELHALEERVAKIYKTNKVGEDANLGILAMLTHIEVRLDELRASIARNHIDRNFVAATLRQKDKERRDAARQATLAKQREQREQRSREALKKSQEPPRKRVGKPVMWRSRPLVSGKQANTDNAEEFKADVDDEFFE